MALRRTKTATAEPAAPPADPQADINELPRRGQWDAFRRQCLDRIAADYWRVMGPIEDGLAQLDAYPATTRDQRAMVKREREGLEKQRAAVRESYAWDHALWSSPEPPPGWYLGQPFPSLGVEAPAEPRERVYEEGEQHPTEDRLLGPDERVTVIENAQPGKLQPPAFQEPPRPPEPDRSRELSPVERDNLVRSALTMPAGVLAARPFQAGERQLQEVGGRIHQGGRALDPDRGGRR